MCVCVCEQRVRSLAGLGAHRIMNDAREYVFVCVFVCVCVCACFCVRVRLCRAGSIRKQTPVISLLSSVLALFKHIPIRVVHRVPKLFR